MNKEKNAIIANKIVATINSAGTPSLFLHTANAIHGNLGRMQNEHPFSRVSKRENILAIMVKVPASKRSGRKLVALAGRPGCHLKTPGNFSQTVPIGDAATSSPQWTNLPATVCES